MPPFLQGAVAQSSVASVSQRAPVVPGGQVHVYEVGPETQVPPL